VRSTTTHLEGTRCWALAQQGWELDPEEGEARLLLRTNFRVARKDHGRTIRAGERYIATTYMVVRASGARYFRTTRSPFT
jgi:hypothetical protein